MTPRATPRDMTPQPNAMWRKSLPDSAVVVQRGSALISARRKASIAVETMARKSSQCSTPARHVENQTHRTKQWGCCWLHFFNVACSWRHERVSLTVCQCVSLLVFRSSKSLTLWQWCCDGTRSRFFEVRFAWACTSCAAPDPSLRTMCRATPDPKRR